MDSNDLRKKIETTDDKFSIFAEKGELGKYNFNLGQLLDIITDFLSDEQKVQLFDLSHFQGLKPGLKSSIIQLISDDSLKISLLSQDKLLESMDGYYVFDIIKTLDDNGKMQMLKSEDFLNKYKIRNFQLEEFIVSLSDENKKTILEDKDLLKNELHLNDYIIISIVKKLNNEQDKLDMINSFEFNNWQTVDILQTFSNESKAAILLEDKHDFNDFNITSLIGSMDTEALTLFMSQHNEFLNEKNISPYTIVNRLDTEKQMQFANRLEDAGLTMAQKRQALASLNNETKGKIDRTNMPNDYITALEFKVDENNKNVIDYEGDLEKYRDLDSLIEINGMHITDQERAKVLELCTICPQLKISDDLGLTRSTAEEYVESEKWISEVLGGLNSEWSDIQKVAYIDNKIGKNISYTPDFDTEDCDPANARALWRIINNGYGVCNGIAQIEKHILDRVGIESQMINSGSHSFLKLKDIELPTANGETVKGDTIIDPTWNLTAQRYGARPDNFCRSYEEIRKQDITDSGKDLQCHKNDEELLSATLDLDEQSLRSIYTSIGIADKEGNFPIKNLIDKSKEIDDLNLPEDESIKKQFMLLQKEHPDFATCQNSTTAILQGVLLANENLKFNKCVVDRVYDKSDEEKQAVMYVYADLPDSGKKFYFADKEGQEFVEIEQKEFEERFECYEADMEKQKGQRPWEVTEKEEIETDLTRSSGKVVASGEMEDR